MRIIFSRIVPLIFFTFIFSFNIASAEDSGGSIEAELDSLYEARSYETLETFALRTLTLSDSLKLSDRAVLHKYLGLFYIIKGREADGKKQFTQWLELDPAGYIDRFNYPPVIVRVYKEVKLEIESNKNLISSTPAKKWEPTTSSVIKSAIVPGWGQYIQGKDDRALIFFISQTVSIAGFVVCNHNLNIANTDYQREIDIDRFDELYDTANNWNYARWFFALTSAAIYVIAQTDFYFLPPQMNLSYHPIGGGADDPLKLTSEQSQVYGLTFLTFRF